MDYAVWGLWGPSLRALRRAWLDRKPTPSRCPSNAKPLPKPEPDTATKAGLVRPAQDPGVVAAQRMSPKRSLSDVQRDVGDPDRQLGSFPIADGMGRIQRITQILLVDPSFR